MSDAVCLLFTKPAIPGRVKTRLIGDLTAEQAAALHQAFLLDLTRRLKNGSFDLSLAWALNETEDLPGELDRGRSDVSAVRQVGATLGDRLFNALAEAGTRYPFVAAVGSDHPELPLEVAEAGFDALRRGEDAVLGPATDGGYYLVGIRAEKLDPRLFADVPWSTSAVLSSTLERCVELGLGVELLEEGSDVDRGDDLERLVQRIRARDVDCPETEKLLAEWGRLVPV